MKVSTSLMAKLFFTGAISLLGAKAIAQVAYTAWPTTTTVVTVNTGTFGGNMSGLFYEPATLWAVQNSPSKLFKMVPSGSNFVKDTTNGWSSGKTLRYPNGSGAPDAEGITKGELTSTTIYVATERDGSGNSKLSVLEYETSGSATTLNATKEWNLTSNLPSVSSNAGLEAIAWVPDSYLVANGFIDESTSAAYDPTRYSSHGTGLFFVGLEANGKIYAYALKSDSTYTKIATISSGNNKIMDLSFDRDNNTLWAYCDNNCTNRSNLLAIDTTVGSATKGKFIRKKAYEKPSSMANLNNEGIAMKPNSECNTTTTPPTKDFFWADDSETSGFAIRRGTIPCGPLF
ncbi:hypothetical protein VB713_28030 [Anabaena cylindrica UHCC 0172]|uniref:hypothetical protein n=1 Tax=Anabaena cylindrica TaxID=1165 RepID=UPI002B1FF591|nr:hypothetical protein [Anabaena cylindrica]MEA5554777.1 hypothetical protein [Anabaena cylindrica UHCC 0172]